MKKGAGRFLGNRFVTRRRHLVVVLFPLPLANARMCFRRRHKAFRGLQTDALHPRADVLFTAKWGLAIPLKAVGQDICPPVFSLLHYGVLGGTYAELGITEEMRKRFDAQDTSSHSHLVSGSRMV